MYGYGRRLKFTKSDNLNSIDTCAKERERQKEKHE